jgi:propanol-preferring alcohol dehydrogenase
MEAAIIFAPVGALVPETLRHMRKGGRVVCAGIHMSDIPAFPYADLWGERSIASVANLTRADGREFFKLLERVPVKTVTTPYPLNEANAAVDRLRGGQVDGACVLVP